MPRPRRYYRAEHPRSSGCLGPLAIGFGIAFASLMLCCTAGMFFAWRATESAQKELAEANRLWDQGDKPAAVGKYKTLLDRDLPGVPSDHERPVVYQRVIEYELGAGDAGAARKWAERALDAKAEPPPGSGRAAELVGEIRAERERRAAEEEARRVAEAKRREEERAAEAKRGQEQSAAEAKRRQEQGTVTASGSGSQPSKGESGYLEVPGQGTVWVSVDEKALGELNAYSRARNEDAIREMMQQDRVLVCVRRTKVAVVDPGFLSTTVRILDGKHEGKTGIVPNEFLGLVQKSPL